MKNNKVIHMCVLYTPVEYYQDPSLKWLLACVPVEVIF